MHVRRSALVDQSAEHLFDLIEAAEHYPQFLPWCAGATIVSRDSTLVSADIQIRYGAVHFELRTRNPKRRPEHMAIHLDHGPFRHFEGEWHVKALTAQACKVEFVLDYEFDSPWMTRVAGPVFNHIANTLVDAFVRRAATTPGPRMQTIQNSVRAEPVEAPHEGPSAGSGQASTGSGAEKISQPAGQGGVEERNRTGAR